ncbi:MAG: helix-hairpin-helix domain-containing protein [Rikenellaceae bacterium]|jgi:competence ComEA-like helix-hairpin-helix protein|nr:helix-hairpin-helix domain-containing protein [Rikenellaceae bacterium]
MTGKSNRGWGFSPRERRALLGLLPVLAVASWLVWEIAHPRADDTLPEYADLVNSTETAPARDTTTVSGTQQADTLFRFDPNTIAYHDLCRLGFSRGEALGIVKYRERGKVFEIPEDFASCYQVSEAMYRRLAPYIIIGESFRLKKLTPCVVERPTPSNAPRGEKPQQPVALPTPLVNLNTADSTTLRGVRGIGERTVGRIIDYRERLGGFARPEQLAEIEGMTEENYERIVPQIFVDSCDIVKIDINFAPAVLLRRHPYISDKTLRKLLKLRQLKGGWNSIGELVQDKIVTSEEAARLVPYLLFRQ